MGRVRRAATAGATALGMGPGERGAWEGCRQGGGRPGFPGQDPRGAAAACSSPSVFVCHVSNSQPTMSSVSPTSLPLGVLLSFSPQYALSDRWSAPSRGPSLETMHAVTPGNPANLNIPLQAGSGKGLRWWRSLCHLGPVEPALGRVWARSRDWTHKGDLEHS